MGPCSRTETPKSPAGGGLSRPQKIARSKRLIEAHERMSEWLTDWSYIVHSTSIYWTPNWTKLHPSRSLIVLYSGKSQQCLSAGAYHSHLKASLGRYKGQASCTGVLASGDSSQPRPAGSWYIRTLAPSPFGGASLRHVQNHLQRAQWTEPTGLRG